MTTNEDSNSGREDIKERHPKYVLPDMGITAIIQAKKKDLWN